MAKSVNLGDILNHPSVYLGGQSTGLTMHDVILRSVRKAYPQWGDGLSTPVKVPGSYNIYAVGTDGDVTLLVWVHNDGKDFTIKAECW